MISSFLIEPMCRWFGPRVVWAISNFTVCVCMAATAMISLLSLDEYSKGAQYLIEGEGVYKLAALILFTLLGFPLSVRHSLFIILTLFYWSMLLMLKPFLLQITYSVPYSMTAELTAGSGGGQG